MIRTNPTKEVKQRNAEITNKTTIQGRSPLVKPENHDIIRLMANKHTSSPQGNKNTAYAGKGALMEALQLMDYPLNKQSTGYSINDVAKREDHAELIKGELVVTAKTSVAHNNAVLEIATALRQFIASNSGNCQVFTENVALYCNELCDDAENLFLPDIMTVCNENGIKDDGVHTAPLFVAEVTSESTKKNDYGRKMLIYSDIGVKEYWVVDLQRKVIVRYLYENEYVPELIAYPFTGRISVHTYPSLEIDLSRLFE